MSRAVLFCCLLSTACASTSEAPPVAPATAAKPSPQAKALSPSELRERELLEGIDWMRSRKLSATELSRLETSAMREIAMLRFERGELPGAVDAAERASREALFVNDAVAVEAARDLEVAIKRGVARFAADRGQLQQALEMLDRLAMLDRLRPTHRSAIAGDRLLVLDRTGEQPVQEIDVKAELETIDRLFGISALLAEPDRTMTSETRTSAASDASVVPLGDPEKLAVGDSAGEIEKEETEAELPEAEEAPVVETGTIDDGTVAKMLALHKRSIEACYDRALRAGSKLSGKLEVDIQVVPTGDVSAAAVKTREFGGTDLGRCVTAAIRRWKFPPIEETKKMTVPFVLGKALY